MHLVTMIVKIPDEEWERFKKEEKEAGSVQFKFGNATIFADLRRCFKCQKIFQLKK